MNELWMMLQKGAGIGAWVVGLALVLVVALPVIGLLLNLIGAVLRIGAGAANRRSADGDGGAE